MRRVFLAAIIVLLLSIINACRACNVAGVFYFCDDEGPHEIVQNPPAAWRSRAAEVQRELYDYTRLHSPADTARFIWRDPATIIFVRVLGHGLRLGVAARVHGDTLLFNPETIDNPGIQRHEDVHWVQPGNAWLEPGGNIHSPSIFDYVHAPLIAG